MNSSEETSQALPTVQPLSNSLPPASSPTPTDEDFDSEPLVGLLPKGQELTQEERRQRVIDLRQMRQSFQTFKAKIEASEKAKEPKKKEQSLDSLKGLLGLCL